jgi:uncharacterized protein YndB with AHSA1/START domain
VRIVRSIQLPCARQEAWEILTRWERQADWMADADRIVVRTAARAGVGVRIDVHTRLFQVPAFVEPMEVVAWDPPRRLQIVHGAIVRGRGTWTLEPHDAGTRFTWREELRLDVPVVGEIVARIYAPVLRRLMDRSQRSLKTLILATGPAAG